MVFSAKYGRIRLNGFAFATEGKATHQPTVTREKAKKKKKKNRKKSRINGGLKSARRGKTLRCGKIKLL